MIPLVAPTDAQPAYVTLDEGLARGTVSVCEVSEQGSVPELLVTNDEQWPVLIIDGEELVGAKQNRIVNVTILVPAKSRLTIPVSCVEAGRWHARSRHFSTVSRAYYASGRAAQARCVTESYRRLHRPAVNQGVVWEDISLKAERFGAYSPTSAMDVIYERKAVELQRFEAQLRAQRGQTGAIFATGETMLGIDIFDASATWRKLLPKLVASYGLEALDRSSDTNELGAGPGFDAATVLASLKQQHEERYPAVGLGEDIRLVGRGMHGAALMLDGRLLHLVAFSDVAAA
jgi:hypothetical protein